MKNSILLICSILFLASCGSSRKVRTVSNKPDPRKIRKVEVVTVDDKKNKNESEEITKSDSKNEQLVATSNITTTTVTVEEYISRFKNIALTNMNDFKIPASIKLAQGILESGAGKGRLCMEANNHFGIKCHSGWNGPSIKHDDDALQECFRKYENPDDSYTDHSKFLTSRPWYKPLFQLDIMDYKAWAHGLKKAGYATDPKYPEKLISIIERYELYKIDTEYSENRTFNSTSYTNNSKPTKNNVHLVVKGDTLYSLSKKYNITVEELKKINKLKDNTLSLGQEIQISYELQ